MTAVDDWDEDDDPYERDDPDDQDDDPDYDDLDYGREPDPEDAEIARAYYEEAEHRDEVHGGGVCDCRPSLAERTSQLANSTVNWLWGIRNNLTAATRRPCTVRVGPAEVTIRLRADRGCCACSGRGWFYTMSPKPEFPVPEGYNGAALCGCGAAIGKLAQTRRMMRRARSEPPF